MTERITSRRNPLLEQVRRLDTAALRRKAGVFLCDSPKLVGEAVQHGVSVQCVIAADGVAFPEGLPENVRQVTVPADVMASISPMPTPQGMLALCALPDMAAPARLSPGRYVVLDGVQDPGNVGAVLRTADAFGCTGALLLPGCADPYGPKTLRAAMGAVFRLGIRRFETAEDCLKVLHAENITSLAAVPDSDATPITTIPFETGNWAVWIGNEGNGLTNEAIEHCHDRVTIPMRGRAESFNASTAAAIVLWEMERNGAGGTSYG